MIKKSSTTIPLSPEELAEASKLFGGSLFSAIQLAREQERRNSFNPGSQGADDTDVLKIPVPASMLPSQKTAEEETTPGLLGRALQSQSNPLKMLLHGQSGFRDARRAYFEEQKNKVRQDLADAQREYIDLLSKIKTGSAEETPCVDAFCNGVAHMTLFGKKASDDVDIETGATKRMVGDLLGAIKSPFKPAIDTAAGGLLSTGAGTAYLTYMLRRKMRENPDKFMEEKLPTRVELEPYV
jgi:hypothetical protein